jgi:response regulator RpfG family c-di-GMP phosphodiesterase
MGAKQQAPPVLMLVDDDPGILSALRRTLRREGYEILIASNARTALAALELRAVDLVVSDQKMPGMKGVVLLEQIARRWPATARILLSGWTSEIPSEQIEAAQIHAVLAKPWDEAELKKTLRSALAAEPN